MAKRGITIVAVLVMALLGFSAAWVSGQGTPAATPGASPAASPGATPGATPTAAGDVERGRALAQGQCLVCHTTDGRPLVGPTWKGLAGSTVELQDGTKVVADDAYLHRSIVDPMKQLVKGYPPAMAPFGKILTEQQIQDLIAYIKSLK
ncbi:MAG TPA: cytochrome c [Thermomicrobiales bacterium]|nr:cytochrome c [Thermomicrobiales bacterium]